MVEVTALLPQGEFLRACPVQTTRRLFVCDQAAGEWFFLRASVPFPFSYY